MSFQYPKGMGKYKKYASILCVFFSLLTYVLGDQLFTGIFLAGASMLYAQSIEDRLFDKLVLP